MNKITFAITLAALVLAVSGTARAGLFLIDLSDNSGSAAGWDVFTTSVTNAPITDRSAGSGDNDVTLSISMETSGVSENNSGAPGTASTIDTVSVPKEARDDYVYGLGGATNIIFEFKNLDAGVYNVSVFEGWTTDSNGQYGKIWVGTLGDEPGSQNTGNFAGSSSTLADFGH